MATGDDGVLTCPTRDGTQFQKDQIDTLPFNEVMCNLVQLLDQTDSSSPMCHRCETDVAEHWCDSD
ncbi:unnamed protein product, partial [Rotaria sp. Silwood2]